MVRSYLSTQPLASSIRWKGERTAGDPGDSLSRIILPTPSTRQEVERARVAGKCSIGPSCGCPQEPGGRDVPARAQAVPFPTRACQKKTLATHTNFRTQRGRKTSLQFKLVLFPFFPVSANLGPSPHLLFPQ